MPMTEIAKRVSIAESIHSAETLKELLQRQLTNRSGEIEAYLRSQQQRFFNALVVGTYGGNPKWHEVAIRKLETRLGDTPGYLEGALGILTLQGTEKLFAIDGQHRVAGIEKALKTKPELGDEEVCVIFLAGVIAAKRSEDPEGFERTRRLFTTLNRYAKPVSKRDIIALDEDDVIAITTRELVENLPLFRNKVSVKKTKSLSISDRTSLTTIVAIYDSLDIFLRTHPRGWSKFKRQRPDDETATAFYTRAVDLFGAVCKHHPPLQKLRDSKPDDEIAARYRSAKGGHILFRPIGFQMVVRTISLLMERDDTLEKAVAATSRVPLQLAKPPWVSLLWDDTNHRMLTAAENQRAAQRLMLHGAGGDLTQLSSSEALLRTELAGVLNVPQKDVVIERYVK
jgi:DNA sulfur modification protein DndB